MRVYTQAAKMYAPGFSSIGGRHLTSEEVEALRKEGRLPEIYMNTPPKAKRMRPSWKKEGRLEDTKKKGRKKGLLPKDQKAVQRTKKHRLKKAKDPIEVDLDELQVGVSRKKVKRNGAHLGDGELTSRTITVAGTTKEVELNGSHAAAKGGRRQESKVHVQGKGATELGEHLHLDALKDSYQGSIVGT
jgi:hypothetical protein